MINELDLVEDRDIRERLAGQIEVLDKVKELHMLENTEYMTTNQVANYYEVDQTAIRQINVRHRDELQQDGVKHYKHKDIKNLVGSNVGLSNISPNGTLLYPVSAVVRIAYLLRDSKIAHQVVDEFTRLYPDEALKYANVPNYKQYEDDMYAYLVSTFGKQHIKRQVKYNGYFIDFVLYDHVAIEVDEHGHSGYIVLNEEDREKAIRQQYKLFRYDTREGGYLDFIYELTSYIKSIENGKYAGIDKVGHTIGLPVNAVKQHIDSMRGEFLDNGMMITQSGKYLLDSRSTLLLQMTISDTIIGSNVRNFIINNEVE